MMDIANFRHLTRILGKRIVADPSTIRCLRSAQFSTRQSPYTHSWAAPATILLHQEKPLS